MNSDSARTRLIGEVSRLAWSAQRCQALASDETIDAPIVTNMLARINAQIDELRDELGPQ